VFSKRPLLRVLSSSPSSLPFSSGRSNSFSVRPESDLSNSSFSFVYAGDASYNPNKRSLEHSPTQAQQPGSASPSLFSSTSQPQFQQQPQQQGGAGARTIYSTMKSPFGAPPPANGAPGGGPTNGGGFADQDSYTEGLYSGPRVTGMGRQPSNDGTSTGGGSPNPMAPQDAPRKRLRRGGPSADDVRLFPISALFTIH
jgi:hypothetical protein